MEIKKIILEKIENQGSVKTSEIQKETGYSRAYINRFMQGLEQEGKIVRVGKANRARYVAAEKEEIKQAKKQIKDIRLSLENERLSEDTVLDKIKRETGIFIDLRDNLNEVLTYAFTEMLNNAIEHSESKEIDVYMERSEEEVKFEIEDYGIGIFKNIRKKRDLNNDLEAIQDLLKGKQTTAPRKHSGEGIFFTSKVADVLTLRGIDKKLVFNNLVDDVFIHDTKKAASGTKVVFSISLDSERDLTQIFRQYTGKGFDFSKTKVRVNLYQAGVDFISRSQARRIITGLSDFEKIILDFDKVETVGQGFADEIFRVWQNRHPEIDIEAVNTNENIEFMIKRSSES